MVWAVDQRVAEVVGLKVRVCVAAAVPRDLLTLRPAGAVTVMVTSWPGWLARTMV